MKNLVWAHYFIFFFTISCLPTKCSIDQKNINNTVNSISNFDYADAATLMPMSRETNGKKVFVFDPVRHAWGAYDSDGTLTMSGKASGGRNYCEDIQQSCRTPAGTYRVFRKGDEDCISKTFPIRDEWSADGGAPMPYCMFFYNGYAIHGAEIVPKYNASHGCVRVETTAAEWLSENFIDIGTTVIILPY